MAYLAPANYELPLQPTSETSREAAERAKAFVGRQGLEVLHFFQDQGSYGATQKEASAALGIERASMCARVHALEKCGDLTKTETKREGCFTYVAARR